MIGGGQDRYALADRISGAFARFARSGDPNHAGIPRWAPFDTEQRTTLIFDRETRTESDPHGAERRAIAEIQGRS
jgi:para-nitrobenzyl esterase